MSNGVEHFITQMMPLPRSLWHCNYEKHLRGTLPYDMPSSTPKQVKQGHLLLRFPGSKSETVCCWSMAVAANNT